jgi:TPR repeat protein
MACATPRAVGRALPKKVSPLHASLYTACRDLLASPPAPNARALTPSPCTRLGRFLEIGYGGPGDAILAVGLFARACAIGDDDACAELGTASLRGFGAPFDPACGAAVLEASCARGGGTACGRLGAHELAGDVIPYDREGARVHLERGCEARSSLACSSLSKLVREADPKRADELEARAVELAERDCADGDGGACLDLVWLYRIDSGSGRFSEELHAKVKDAEKAEAFASKACRAHARFGCVGHRDVAKDEEASCEGGDFERCIDLAFERVNASGRGGDFAKADVDAVERACVGGSSRGCWALGPRAKLTVLDEACDAGVLEACRPQSHYELPIPRTTSLRKRGCDLGSAIDCRELGEAERDAGRFADALAHFERVCPSIRRDREYRDVDAKGCVEAARRYRDGKDAPRDADRAVELFTNACFAEGRLNPRGYGCVELAAMFDTGDGVPKDPDRALDLLAGACSADRTACPAFTARVGEKP